MSTSLKRWIGRIPDVSAVMARFPVPVGLMGIFTVLLIIVINQRGNEEQFAYLLGGIILAAYLMVSFTLSRETNQKAKAIPIQIGISLLICVAAWFARDIYFFLPAAIAGAILMLGNSVRHRRDRDDLHIWDFTHKLWTGAVFAAVGSIIFVMGMLAITFALKTLFGIDMSDLIEEFMLPIGLGFLAPLYWMSTLPPVDEPYAELHDNPGFVSKAVAFLGTWLLTPLILIYALILLAYGVKILLDGSLPKGEIAQLTTPFLLIGTLNWLVLEPPFIQGRVLARLFRRTWFWLSIPAAIMLGIAIFVRIANYGLTIERIIILFVFLWAIGIGLWFSLMPERRRDIRFIPGLAAMLAIVASILGPISSVINQDKRLGHYLKKSGIIVDGEVPRAPDISDMDAAKNAKGALNFLIRNKEDDRILRRMEKLGLDTQGLLISDLSEKLGLTGVIENTRRPQVISYNKRMEPISVKGYELIAGPYAMRASRREIEIGGYALFIDQDTIELRDHLDQTIASQNIIDWALKIQHTSTEFVVKDPVIVLHDEGDLKVILHVITLNKYADDKPYGEFYVLSKGLTPKP